MPTWKKYNYQISVNYPLTEFTTGDNLKNVLGGVATRHNVKQTKGGNVTNTQPPLMCGFFMPATSGDCTFLPGVVDYKIPAYGKVHSVSFRTLNGTRQFYSCPNVKQTKEVNAMHNATTHATGAPAPAGKGLSPTSRSTRCILSSDLLLNVLVRAKQKRQQDGRANAYAELLEQFHKAILPAFFIETQGNLSEVSRLLGLHRETVKVYATLAEIDMTGKAVKAVNL